MYRSETAFLSLVLTILIASVLLPTPSRGQAKSLPQHDTSAMARAKTDYSQEPYIIETAHTMIRFESDGTGERVSSFRVRLQSDSAAEKFDQLIFPFSTANQKVEVRRVLVHKRNGMTTTVPTDAVKEGPAAGQDGTEYPGEVEKSVAVPGLDSGDILEYEVVTRLTAPFAANQFWAEYKFIRDAIVLDEQVELNLPLGRAFSVKGPGYQVFDGKAQSNDSAVKGVSFSRSDEGGRTVLRWRHTSLTLSSEGDQQRTAEEALRSPDIQLTTFRDWQQVARWETELWKDKVQPGTEVKAKAAELTQGLATEDEKIRALYAFVSRHIRVGDSAFGSEHFAPRNPADILSSGYGDSADSHILLAALLSADGIITDTALMPSAWKLDPGLPSPGQFKRVLTVVPHGANVTWLDPSAQVAPFDFLPAPLRGRSAILVELDGSAKIVKTPVDPPFASTQMVEIDAAVSDLGKLSGTIHYSVRGDTEFVLRTAFHRAPQSQWNELAQTVLKLDGLNGEVQAAKASDPEDTEKPFELDIEFSQQGFLDWSNPNTRVALPLLTIGMPDIPPHSGGPIQLGTPLNVVTHLRLKFPAQFSIDTPVGTRVERDYAEFTSGYHFENGVLTADRALNFKLREVSQERAVDYRAFTTAVNADEAQSLAVNNNASQPGVIPADASADDVFAAGTAALKAGNLNQAIPLLRRVTEIDPKYEHAWNDLGLAYLRSGMPADAVSAFQRQLELKPADEHANNYLGLALEQEHRNDEAAAAFRNQIALDPLDTVAHGALGTIMLEEHDAAGAVNELEKAVILTPKSAGLELSLGRAYLETAENQKALDAFHKAIALSPTGSVWNNVAHNLAEHNLNLDEALGYAIAAVKAADEKLAKVTLASSTQADFARSHDLAAYWDTLGWLYFRKGDLANAERYVTSALLVSSRAASFDHLAQIYQKRGDKQRAEQMYAVALSKTDTDPDTRARFTLLLGGNAQIDALVGDARNRYPKPLTLKLAADSTASGSADFSILLSPRRGNDGAVLAHADDVKFLAGNESLQPLADSLRSQDYGPMFPVLSSAKLVLQGKLTCPGTDTCTLTFIPAADIHAQN